MINPSLPISIAQLVQQLRNLGVPQGSVLLVHTAFSKVKPVEGGPQGLITALQTAVGPQGTLVMPAMTDEDQHPFDPASTPCLGMGVVANTFWQLPGVLRSNNPHSFAACGPAAGHITAEHPIDVPHGIDSPVGRVYEMDGQVLLLGVGHTSNTTIHLAENMAGVRYRRKKYLTILKAGVSVRFDYAEIDHCCQNFTLVGQWLEAKGLQRRGRVGYAEALLARSRDIVNVVLEHLHLDETIFLHPYGVDEECDEARESLTASR